MSEDTRDYTMTSKAFGMVIQTLIKHHLDYATLGAIAVDLARNVKDE